MNKEKIEKDIIMQIELDSYMKFNDEIATMNDHLGEMYGYRDLEDIKQAQLQYEKELAYKYLKREHQALLDIKEIFTNYEELEKVIGAGKPRFPLYKVQRIVNKAIGSDKE